MKDNRKTKSKIKKSKVYQKIYFLEFFFSSLPPLHITLKKIKKLEIIV